MAHELPALPYDRNALAPHISEETLDFHYGKHHQTYVDNLNKMVDDDSKSLEDIIKSSSGGLFNNAAQVWNHTFYWHSLSPNGGGQPSGALGDAISSKWGGFDAFKDEFTKSATGNFGSGWTWLVKNDDGSLDILNTDDADTAMTHGKTALLTCDVWEHAYYIDYRNARPKYLAAYWEIANWDFASKNFSG